MFNPLSTSPTKLSNTLKHFVGNLPKNCLSVFDHFVRLVRKGVLLIVFERKKVCFDVLVLLLQVISSINTITKIILLVPQDNMEIASKIRQEK